MANWRTILKSRRLIGGAAAVAAAIVAVFVAGNRLTANFRIWIAML